ncbi:NEDD4-binding protein 2-like isoform X2 [Haliotis rufescens]|uniref:NEDD4-binding protein 2-like isoform X2 n=1 Tax=Haliotis rufescens TaxID=6454 RepID=UPI00201EA1D4|nr:NEDD4-binding protein 2-like isoform X2 [Haliotis rufescens]
MIFLKDSDFKHGVNAKDAKSKLECFLEQKEQERKRCNGSMTLTIITGKGNHSPHGHPVLKPVVKKYLENNGYTHNVDPQNTGRLFVQLP